MPAMDVTLEAAQIQTGVLFGTVNIARKAPKINPTLRTIIIFQRFTRAVFHTHPKPLKSSCALHG